MTGSDLDGWSARLAHLASLARVDALAIVLPPRDAPTTYAAHNLPAIAWSNSPAAATLMNVLSQRSPSQLGAVGIPLADGRSAESLVAAPIVWKDQLIGALVAAAARPIAPDDVASIARAADLVAIDLAETNGFWRAQRQVQDLEGRVRVIRELRRAQNERDLPGLLDRAVAVIAELFSADGVSIMLANDAAELTVRASRGLSEAARRARVPIGEGIGGGVARSGQPTMLSGPVAGGSDETVTESLIAPLRAGDRTLGVVSVKHRGLQPRYARAQLDSLSLIAQDIASIYSATEQLIRAEEDRLQAIVLYELARFATLGEDPASDLGSATAMLAGTLRHDCVTIWQNEADKLRLRAATGYDAEVGLVFRPDESDTTLATVLLEKRPTRRQLGALEARPIWADPHCAQFLLAPISGQGLLVVARATTPFTDGEVDFAATVAEYLVGMLQKSQTGDAVDRGVGAERRRIAQEIHDGLAQELTGVVLALEGSQRALEKDPSLLGPQLQRVSRDARATLADVRQYMAALRQNSTGMLNLPVTLGRLVDDLRRQTGLHVEMTESGTESELEPIVERAVIRIVGEALRNVAQHASAKQAKVALDYGPDGVVITIEDDGRGFDVEQTFSSAEGRGHFGVVGMRERAEAAGGELVVRSEIGRGSIVRANIPYTNRAAFPGATSGIIEDAEQLPAIEEQDTEEQETSEKGFFTRLFGR